MKTYLLTLIISLVGTNALAFDRLYCESDMKDWVVSVTESTKTAVLTPYNQNTLLTETQSEVLYVKGSNAETVITIIPWNSLYVRVPVKTKKDFEVKTQEVSAGFLIEIADKKSKVKRSLNCRFTF